MLTVGQPRPRVCEQVDRRTGRAPSASCAAARWSSYFLPRAFTAGCTVETTAFAITTTSSGGSGAEIIGISTDEHETQCRFAEARKVKFPLIGDASGEISKAYDVAGRFFGGDKRVTYVIDEAGVIAAVFHHELRVGLHIDEVRQFLQKRRPSQGSPRP